MIAKELKRLARVAVKKAVIAERWSNPAKSGRSKHDVALLASARRWRRAARLLRDLAQAESVA